MAPSGNDSALPLLGAGTGGDVRGGWCTLSQHGQEWVLGVTSPWILTPILMILLDALWGVESGRWTKWFGAVLPDGAVTGAAMQGALMALLAVLHSMQTVFSVATWRRYDPKCWRLQFDRLNVVVLTGTYVSCAWVRGRSTLAVTVVLIMLFAACYASTFWTVKWTGQYVLQHLTFRYIAWLVAVLVLFDPPGRCWSLVALFTPVVWASNLWAIRSAKQLESGGGLWAPYYSRMSACFAVTAAFTLLQSGLSRSCSIPVLGACISNAARETAPTIASIAPGIPAGGVLALVMIYAAGELMI